MKIRLERKFAELINDVNISKYRVGDVVDLPLHDAKMLLAEGWATALDTESSDLNPHSSMYLVFPEREKTLS